MNAQAKVSTAIFGKMVAILSDMNAIGKNSRNTSQGFDYRGIDDVYNAINPILAKHGVFMTAQVIEKSRDERTNQKGTVLAFTCLRMRYRFYSDDGSYVETEAEGEGMDSGDKSSNKAMAIAHKYALLQAFCIPTKDLDDPDAEAHHVAAKAPDAAPQELDGPPAPMPEATTANGTKKAAAIKWGNDALAAVRKMGDSKTFDAWHKSNRDTVARVKEYDADLHSKLTGAIGNKIDAFNPIGAF